MENPPSKEAGAEELATRFLDDIKQFVVRLIQSTHEGNLDKFDEIEGQSAAVGDLLTRNLMVHLLNIQKPITVEEEKEARAEVLKKVSPGKVGACLPEDLRMTRIFKEPIEIKTVRGPISYRRTYLYFPDLQTGIFPPR